MRIDFTGRQMEVTSDLRRYTEERLRMFSRFFKDRWTIHVILTAEKHRRIAEISLKVRDHVLVGMEETADARASINGALEKLKRQTVRLVERRRKRKRRPQPTAAVLLNVLGVGKRNHAERVVLETERIPISALSMDDALGALRLASHGAVVFRNLESDRVNVLYRRDDGRLGLIVPEE